MKARTRAYAQGARAFQNGFSPDDNPHKMGGGNNADRIDWFDGFYDERHDTRFGAMFAEAGLLTMKEERAKQWKGASC